jgi:hypothetical protein
MALGHIPQRVWSSSCNTASILVNDKIVQL